MPRVEPFPAVLRQQLDLPGIALHPLRLEVDGVLYAHAAQTLQEFRQGDGAAALHGVDQFLPGHEQGLLLLDGLAAGHGAIEILRKAVAALLGALAQHVRVAQHDDFRPVPVDHAVHFVRQHR